MNKGNDSEKYKQIYSSLAKKIALKKMDDIVAQSTTVV